MFRDKTEQILEYPLDRASSALSDQQVDGNVGLSDTSLD